MAFSSLYIYTTSIVATDGRVGKSIPRCRAQRSLSRTFQITLLHEVGESKKGLLLSMAMLESRNEVLLIRESILHPLALLLKKRRQHENKDKSRGPPPLTAVIEKTAPSDTVWS